MATADYFKPIETWPADRVIRSCAAAALMSSSGFKEVHSVEGGMNAWQGRVAEGPPDSGIVYFSPAAHPEELIALAWLLEDGSRIFYSGREGRERRKGKKEGKEGRVKSLQAVEKLSMRSGLRIAWQMSS